MNEYTVYLPTGEILRSGKSNVDPKVQVQKGELVIASKSNPSTQFVDVSKNPHTIRNRPVFPVRVSKSQIIANLKDTTSLSGIPKKTRVIQPGGDSFEITDGVFEFCVDLPGSYVFILLSPFYITKEIYIEAVATD